MHLAPNRRPVLVPRSLTHARLAALAGLLAVLGCQAPQRSDAHVVDAAATISAQAPAAVAPEWKERLATAYVYVEHVGDYRRVGDALRDLFERARRAGLEPDGPPFTLFYDDPGAVPVDRLRARACLPVGVGVSAPPGLQADVLPQAMVVYGRVTGAYDRVPESYPRLFAYLQDKHWTANGPIREVYLVDPASVDSWDQLVTEVQIPWTVR